MFCIQHPLMNYCVKDNAFAPEQAKVGSQDRETHRRIADNKNTAYRQYYMNTFFDVGKKYIYFSFFLKKWLSLTKDLPK